VRVEIDDRGGIRTDSLKKRILPGAVSPQFGDDITNGRLDGERHLRLDARVAIGEVHTP
jgi:hypothetical protein